MTITAERHTHVGTRRYSDRPREVRRPRHRKPFDALALVPLFSPWTLGDKLARVARAAWAVLSGSWAARTTARAAVVVAVSAFLLAAMLFGSVLVMVEPLRNPPRASVVTPSPTPYPGDWTYTP